MFALLEKMLNFYDNVSDNLIDQEDPVEEAPEDSVEDSPEDPVEEVPEESVEEASEVSVEEAPEESVEEALEDPVLDAPEDFETNLIYTVSENSVSGNYLTVEQLAYFDTTVIFLLACVLGALIFNAFMKKL